MVFTAVNNICYICRGFRRDFGYVREVVVRECLIMNTIMRHFLKVFALCSLANVYEQLRRLLNIGY